MSPEEIRAEAIERLARFRYEQDVPGEWESMPEEIRERARRWAAPVVDALGDMLPTQAEWYVVYDDPDHGKILSTFCHSREQAEHQIRCNEDEFHDGRSSLARRFLTDWQAVTE